MYDQVMNDVCNWCISFLYKASDYLGVSYEEINVWLFTWAYNLFSSKKVED